ncbi:MAG: 4Fe-4S binding protein [Lachnospiraceae bacterium]|nr:4Fe-4S binding protein [Lachnospiraceae bacterium]MDD3795306.1 4Fe-4S binding protein [Lachnospiraceae bacterium]
MKKLVVTDKTKCMACLECVRACSMAFYKEFDPDKSCIQIVEGKDGNPKPNTCIQCGKCARTCKAGAIKQNAKGVYMIDKKLCTGCGECVEVCPMHVMVKVESSPVSSKCISCGICAKACPMDILEIQEK